MTLVALLRRGAAPQEFYRFQYVGTSTALAKWTASDGGREFLIPAAISPTGAEHLDVYLPVPITREATEGTDERGGAGLKIIVPRDHTETDVIVDLYRDGVSPVTPVEVCLYFAHRGHRTAARHFFGNIASTEFKGRKCILNCEPKSGILRHPILRQRFQAPCNNTLGDEFCGVDLGAFAVTDDVTAIAADGVTLTIPDAALETDGFYGAGGRLVFGSRYGFIREHVGDQITLLTAVPGLVVGSTVTISAGCDRSLTTCTTKFSNTANHQGYPFIPTADPFRHGVRR